MSEKRMNYIQSISGTVTNTIGNDMHEGGTSTEKQ